MGHAPPAREDRLDRMLGLLERLIQGGAGIQAGVGAQAPGIQQQIPDIAALVGQPPQVLVVPMPVNQPPQVPAPIVGAPAAIEVVLPMMIRPAMRGFRR